MKVDRTVSLGAAILFVSASSFGQPVAVTHDNGLLTIQCKDAPLSSVFESIEREAGIDLTLEDEVKSKRITANLTEVPVAMAVSRLLEGVGVNYIVMMDPSDWGRVDKIFVGAGGGGAARAAQSPMRGPVEQPMEPEEAYEDVAPDSPEAMDAMGQDAMDPGLEAPVDDQLQNPDEFGVGEDPGVFPAPPGSSPLPDFLPPTQSFPRSNFTPGLPSNRQQPGGLSQPQQTQEQEQDPNAPPATFPFTDPFGRPIPIPPGMTNPQQQGAQQKRQQQQQRQQQ